MAHEYKVTRKLQKQPSGAFLITVPKIWVDAQGLKGGERMIITFNGSLNVEPANVEPEREPIVEEDYNETRRPT